MKGAQGLGTGGRLSEVRQAKDNFKADVVTSLYPWLHLGINIHEVKGTGLIWP